MIVQLSYRPPYEWASVMSFLGARAIPGVEVVTPDRYTRTIHCGGAHGIVSVERAAGHALQVTVNVAGPGQRTSIVERVRRVFDLDADPAVVDVHLAQDAALEPLVRRRPGLRVPGGWDGFELAVRAIAGQQVTLRAGVVLAGRLAARYGERLRGDVAAGEPLTHVFPRPDDVAAIDLRALGMPAARARALSSLAAAMLRDPDVLCAAGSLQDCVARLASLPGVGEWTAHYIAMRLLRHPDAFPASDVALRRAFGRIEGAIPTAEALLARAERWRPWRAYAAQHLWSA